ncbi:MAG: PIG-L family deacetylase [Gemmatimonadota bacterium]|nr:MAG: PIG-L family deacetylase [Gemmatimonadota bacterium]
MRAKRRSLAVLVACLLLGSGPLAAQLVPPSTGGAAELDRVLQRLAHPGRVLVIGAHPDDEDTRLLALLARGYGADAGYLSLSRGEGGQNLIGDELGVALGLLRSQELASARRVDGAQQFFTRAYDFGYSRTLEETQRFWLPDSVLKDAVRVVRRFRPQVIVAIWSGTPRDRHGQHQMAGVVAREVFDAAGEPGRFPELEREEGLTSWQPLKLYQSARFDTAATTLLLETGGLDPRSGSSYHQIAMESRSQHRSQDMGQLQPTGPHSTRLQLIADRTGANPLAANAGLFAGIPPDTSRPALLADSLRAAVSTPRIGEAVPALATALRETRAGSGTREQIALLERALAVAGGVVIDAQASGAVLVPGATVEIDVQCYNAGTRPLELKRVGLSVPEGWRVTPRGAAPAPVPPGGQVVRRFGVTVPAGAEPTQPYFLARPLVGSLYDWRDAPAAVRGEPFAPPLVTARVEIELLGSLLTLTREVSYRSLDQAVGEVRSPLRVAPAIEVSVAPDRLVWSSADEGERVFTVTLTANGRDPLEGEVALEADGWATPPAQAFRFERAQESGSFEFRLPRPADGGPQEITVRAVARTRDGGVFDRAVTLVDYPHIRPTGWITPAESAVRLAAIALPDLQRIGYVRGAADRVPEALAQIGVPVELLEAEALARADLAHYDAIVIGSRAYETDPALVRHNGRLLEYVAGGGLLLVQYQQYQFVRGAYAAHPLTIGVPHDRVTDETAPVRVLRPDHPVFVHPNRLGGADWEGWPQERGLYFARTWDDAYTPLLAMADPGMPELEGGLLVARYGEGTYVYTGISFFRSLPAGTPGAYRLFLNLLALAERDAR